MKSKLLPALSVLAACFWGAPLLPAASTRELPAGLFAGRGAEAALRTLPAEPTEAADVFAHATVEMLAAVEALGRDFYLHGLHFEAGRSLPVPFLRLQIPRHPDPRPATAADVRRALDEFHGRLAKIDERLAKIEGREFKAVIPLGAAGFDFAGAGRAEDRVGFGPFFAGVAGRGGQREPGASDDFVVAFDQTDALWLRAYTQLLRGLADVMLAHDGGALFEKTGHLYFAKADTALARLLAERGNARAERGLEAGAVADIIATLHGLDLAVSEPARLARAREELLAMARLSRATLASAEAETDDDREWLPSTKQGSVFGLRIDDTQARAWTGVLAEVEALLEGRKLLPHWRFPGAGGDGSAGGYGLNLRRMFEESRRTDLIGYIQGAAALTYLEKGPTTSLATWRELTRVFGGNFLGYAVWIN